DPNKVEVGETCENKDLASFLIARACNNPTLANFLYWYLWVECEDQEPGLKPDTKVREMYLWVLRRFKLALQQGNSDARASYVTLTRQGHFMENLVALVKSVAKENINRVKKNEKLRSLLEDTETFNTNFACFEPLPLPLDPD
ncbi:unnamed protein product, partial [Meganyctiphanes norvegica]